VVKIKSAENDGFITIRAKGQQLKVPKEFDDENIKIASGAGELLSRYLGFLIC